MRLQSVNYGNGPMLSSRHESLTQVKTVAVHVLELRPGVQQDNGFYLESQVRIGVAVFDEASAVEQDPPMLDALMEEVAGLG